MRTTVSKTPTVTTIPFPKMTARIRFSESVVTLFLLILGAVALSACGDSANVTPNAADTSAADSGATDEHGHAELRRTDRGDIAARSRPDDRDVVGLRRIHFGR